MTTPNTEGAIQAAAVGTAQGPKATTKPNTAPRAPGITPAKAKAAKKTTLTKKQAKTQKTVKATKPAGAREGSKTQKVLDLLKRPGGVTLQELMKATGWQPHSVRGFLSGNIGKKMGLDVTSTKGEDRECNYSIQG